MDNMNGNNLVSGEKSRAQFSGQVKYFIAKSFWGMDESDLDEVLAEYASDEEEYSY